MFLKPATAGSVITESAVVFDARGQCAARLVRRASLGMPPVLHRFGSVAESL